MSVSNAAVTVGTTATVVAAVSSSRRQVTFYNANVATIFLGGASVTTTNGHPLVTGASLSVTQEDKSDIRAKVAWYAIVAAATEPLRVLSVRS